MKMFDADKTRMIGLPYGEKNYDNMLSRFHLYRNVTDGRTDRIAISISRVSVLTRGKNGTMTNLWGYQESYRSLELAAWKEKKRKK